MEKRGVSKVTSGFVLSEIDLLSVCLFRFFDVVWFLWDFGFVGRLVGFKIIKLFCVFHVSTHRFENFLMSELQDFFFDVHDTIRFSFWRVASLFDLF